MRLIVKQFGRRIGQLESTPDRGIVFAYDSSYAASAGASPLSLSLPLRVGDYSQAAAMPFFAGLLPDGDLRLRIAGYLHISETSTLKLLDALGGECAGTISIERDAEAGDNNGQSASPGDAATGGYTEMSADELSAAILGSERRPLLVSNGATRLSLAGAQDKLPLFRRDGGWFRSLGGYPTTHILKPATIGFPDIVANEFFCMRLAESLGLGVPKVEMVFLGRPVLVVERYDRRAVEDGVERVHQEDFCQAAGIMPDKKYQSDGGPGFGDLSRIIRSTCAKPVHDIERLIRGSLFNVLVGNCDAHGKNFSILYGDTGPALAPFYDLLSTTIYAGLERKLSMKIGNEYRIDKIGPTDLAAFATDLGVRPRLVVNELERLVAEAQTMWDTAAGLQELEPYEDTIKKLRAGWMQRAMRLSSHSDR